MKIKKKYVLGLALLVCLYSGYALLKIIYQSLVNSEYGFIFLILFISGLIFVINYFYEYNSKIHNAKEAAKEVTESELKTNPKFVQRESYGNLKNLIEEHLVNKIENEYYIFWNKKTK